MITCRTSSFINQKNVEVMLSIPKDLWEVIEKSEEWRRILCAEDLTILPAKESSLQSIASSLERIEGILQIQQRNSTLEVMQGALSKDPHDFFVTLPKLQPGDCRKEEE